MAAAQRIHKLLAAAGHGSRRQIEQWIQAGRVSVNGQTAVLGQRLTGRERVTLDGRPLTLRPAGGHRHLMYYKPVGEVTTRRDERGRQTVFQRLPSPGQRRWVTVGRLDISTQGLLLLTTDGELANRLMHPRYEIERRYAVRILGRISPEQRQQLTGGVELEDGPARFLELKPQGGQGSNSWWHVSLAEGRNREVRRLFAAVGLTVSRLIRVGYGPVGLDQRLRRGHSRPLTPQEVSALYRSVSLTAPKGRRTKRRAMASEARIADR